MVLMFLASITLQSQNQIITVTDTDLLLVDEISKKQGQKLSMRT